MLWQLIKLNNQAINAIALPKTQAGKEPFLTTRIGRALMNLISYLFLGGMAAFGGASIARDMADAGQTTTYFAIFVGATCAMSLVGSIYALYTILYKNADNSILLPLPIRPQILLLARLTSSYITSFETGCIILLAGAGAYFVQVHFDLVILIMTLVALLIVPVLSLSIAMILTWVYALLIRISPLSKRATQGILYILAVGLYIAYISLSTLIGAGEVDFVSLINTYAPVFSLAGAFITGDLKALLIFSLYALVPLIIMSWLMSRNYLSFTVEKSAARKHVPYKAVSYKSQGVLTALVKKDFSQLSGDPALLMNYLGSVPLIVVILIVNVLIAHPELDNLASVGQDPSFLIFVGFGLAFTSLFMSGTAALISLEGPKLSLIKSMPISSFTYVQSKLVVGVGSLLVMDLIISAIIAVAFRPDALMFIFVVLFALSFALCMQTIAVVISLLRIRIQALTPVQALKRSSNNLIYMAASLIVLAPAVLLYMLPHFIAWWTLTLEPIVILGSMSVVYLVLGALAYLFLQRRAEFYLGRVIL